MRTGRDLIRATKAYAKENRALSWTYLLSTLAFFAVTFALTQLPIFWPLRLAASILTGLLIVRVFVIFHDYQHGAILNESKIGLAIMNAVGIYTLAPSSVWKRTHDYHHKHNSKLFSASIGSYPIMTRARFASATPGERRLYLTIRHPLTILFAYLTMFVWGFCINSFVSSGRRHWDGLLAIGVHVAIGVTLFWLGGWQALVFGQTIPAFISSAMGAYLFYAQHNFPGVSFKENTDWCYEHAALQSSSYMRMPRVMHWFTANIGYHHIHHLNSRIPFYRLPEAMKGMPELQNPKSTSLSLKGILSCLRLKVWDADAGMMISTRKALEPLPAKAAVAVPIPVPVTS
jgi:omega-6 fatty acid desaturase (delta-12 desaturase)